MGLAHSSSIRVITNHPDLKLTFLIPLFGGLFPRSATETVHRRGIPAPHLTGRKTTRVLVHLDGFLSLLCSSTSSCVVLYPLSWRQGADHFLESVELRMGDWVHAARFLTPEHACSLSTLEPPLTSHGFLRFP